MASTDSLSRELFDCFVEKVTHMEIVREGPMVTIKRVA